jgi:hypothetical protein
MRVDHQGVQERELNYTTSAIHLNDQENPDSSIPVVGQFMEMTQSAEKTRWEWNRKFIKIDTSEAASYVKNKQLLLQFPSSENFPLAPDVTEFNHLNEFERATWTFESSSIRGNQRFCLDYA